MTRLICHIGFEKTGSTSIQSFLNKQELEGVDVPWLYPQTGKVHGHHFEIAKPKISARELRDSLLKEATGADLVVISSEHFSHARNLGEIQEYAEVFSEYDVSIVFYLRDPYDWLISLYGEYIKWGGHLLLHRFYQAQEWQFNYVNLIKRWVTVFGRDQIQAFNYHDDENVVGHFYREILGQDDAGGVASTISINKSDQIALLELLRKMNAAFGSIDAKRLKTLITAKLEEKRLELIPYDWPIGPKIVKALEKQRQRTNEYFGNCFFDKQEYVVVDLNRERERAMDELLAKLLGFFEKSIFE